MRILASTLPLLLLALASPQLAAAAVQDDAAQSPATSQAIDLGLDPAKAAQKGPDGISFGEAYKRALIYSVGAFRVQQLKIQMLTEVEVERRRSAGEDLSHLEVTEEEVKARIDSAKERTAQRSADIDFWSSVEATGNTRESYRQEVRRMLLMEKLFFPPDPSKWPPILETIYAKGEENSMWESLIVPTRTKFETAWAEGKSEKVDEMVMQLLLRPYILKWMLDSADITEPFEGLPEGVALLINSREIKTDELLGMVAGFIGPVERERAAAWVELSWALQKGLAAKDSLLTPAETIAIIDEEKKEYENSPISYEQVAIQFLGYPTMEMYHQQYRLRQSFRKTLPDPYPLDLLKEHLDERRQFLADGKVDAEVILLSARDMMNGRFAMEGDPFAEAEERARKAAEELAGGGDWDEVLLKYSDYPEKTAGTPAGVPQPNRGRFGKLSRNPLREFLGENDYTDFLYGNSVADSIFFDAEPGTIYGPVRGATGWFIYKVNGREAPTREIDVAENDRHIYLVGDDYLTVKYHEFIDQTMSS